MLDFVLSLLPLDVLTKGIITVDGVPYELTPQSQTFICIACICVFFMLCAIVVTLFNILTDMFRTV